MTLQETAEKMAKIDICMMTTIAENGSLTARPMSNNGDVKYDGNSYFFTDGSSNLVSDIRGNENVNLAFDANDNLYISVAGRAKLITDKEKMKEHWNPDLETWFKEGIDTPGITMIHVKADSIKYWKDYEEGEVKLNV